MVVHNFHVQRIFALPAEANPPLVIDTDAVLPVPVALQRFKPISRWSAQILQAPGLVQQQQLSPSRPLNLRRQPPGRFVIEQPLSFRAGEAANQLPSL